MYCGLDRGSVVWIMLAKSREVTLGKSLDMSSTKVSLFLEGSLIIELRFMPRGWL